MSFFDDDDGDDLILVDDDDDQEMQQQSSSSSAQQGNDMDDDDDEVQVIEHEPNNQSTHSMQAENNNNNNNSSSNIGNGEQSPRTTISFEGLGDPNVKSFQDCSEDLTKMYVKLEASVSELIKSKSSDNSELESNCLQSLRELNYMCDKLRRLAERKEDVIAVEKVLLNRTDEELQENPQEIIKVKTENLSLSRSEFQKVLLE